MYRQTVIGCLLCLLALFTVAKAGYLLTTFEVESHENDTTTINELIEMVNSNYDDVDLSHKNQKLSLHTLGTDARVELIKLIQSKLSIPDHHVHQYSLAAEKIKDSYRRKKRSYQIFDINAFNSYDSVAEYMAELSYQYSKFVSSEIIGHTIQSRPIKVLKINIRPDLAKPRVFIDGGQHAREWIAPAVVLHMTHQLIEGYMSGDPAITSMLERYDFHMIPILNPDGYAYSYASEGNRLWRKNRRQTDVANCTGVDLNRNWDFHWAGKGSSQDVCSYLYQGEAAFSESETKAASEYILRNVGWHSYFSFHSYGQMILFPYSHTNMPGPEYMKHMEAGQSLASAIHKLNARNYAVGAVGMMLYAASGSSESWAYSVGIPYTFTVELPNLYTFLVEASEIKPTAQEWIHGLIHYFNHTETNDPKAYSSIRANISKIEGLREFDPVNKLEKNTPQPIFKSSSQRYQPNELFIFTTVFFVLYGFTSNI